MFDYTYSVFVQAAYIIRIKGHDKSERLAQRCAESCARVAMPYEFFDAVDGTSGTLQNVPDQQVIRLLKQVNKTLTPTEVSCLLSHFLLWAKCVELDQPIVILEHDAVMVQPYSAHNLFNVISYLGCNEQATGWPLQLPIPPHGQMNENYRFLLRTHAYALDPMIARRLVAKVIERGIYSSVDVLIRADEFAIIQVGLYAYDLPEGSTIPKNDDLPDITKINNKLLTG